MKKWFWLMTCSLLAVSLSAQGAPSPRPVKPLLTKELADKRASVISDVHYDLEFEMDEKNLSYKGKTVVKFNLRKVLPDLSLDFEGGKILAFKMNGAARKDYQFEKYFVSLPKDGLKEGANTIEIVFEHPFAKEGSGLYRFKDPADQNVYVYTDFEPYDANKMFPCFDQPDLKATYSLKVKAPSSWTVITSVREEEVKKAGKQNIWTFPSSAKFSTYIFPLHAGPYHKWERDFRIPLRLFARQSEAKYVQHDYWLDVTAKGFDFFEQYFDEPYPFKKYDQIIVPDFNAGAMENVGAVTFSERFLMRSAPTKVQKESLANVVHHEMAHMWFGNLVTMRWWDDLWLNESFATYMAYQAKQNVLKAESTWRDFFRGTKSWAYWEDELATTHPITTEVTDTDTALTNFDGITYGKGASVLHQLNYQLGENGFRDGVRLYFNRFAYQNTRLSDFMASLAEASKKDLSNFTKTWLETPGLSTMAVDYKCDDDEIEQFVIKQIPDKRYPTLREHRSQVALLKRTKTGDLVVYEKMPYSIKGASVELDDLEDKDCPDAVYVNYNDYDYARAQLDSKTKMVLQEGLGRVEDIFLRMKFWKAFWDEVRDARFSVEEFAAMTRDALKNETSEEVVRQVAGYMEDGLLYYLGEVYGSQSPQMDRTVDEFAAIIRKRLETAEPGSDLQKFWFGAYVNVVRDGDGQQYLVKLLRGRSAIEGLRLGQDLRWNMLVRLSQLGAKEAALLRKEELKKDKSHEAKKNDLMAQAVFPSLENKKHWWREIFNLRSKLSPVLKSTVARALFPRDQKSLQVKFNDDFYKAFPGFVKQAKDNLGYKVVRGLVPALCNDESINRLQRFVGEEKEFPTPIVKVLKVAREEDERCARVRDFAIKDRREGKRDQG